MRNLSFALLCFLLLSSGICNKNDSSPGAGSGAPSISSISAPGGIIGDTIDIYGANFSTITSDNTVEFNGIAAKVISATDNTIVVVIPPGTTTGNVTITVNGQAASSSGSPPSFTVLSYNFYIVGGSASPLSSTYLKNGAVVATIPNATLLGIFASGNDIYTCGFTTGSNNITTAAYWKNGIEVPLSDGTKNASASGIWMSGGDMYIAGGDGTGVQYWKNGILVNVPVSGTIGSGGTNLIYVSGNDVYVAGAYFDANNIKVSAYWKNGVQTNLPGNLPYTYSLSVFNGDVYVAGQTFNGKNQAAFWKNGVRTDLLDGSTATGVYVSGTDVYVSGYTSGNGGNDPPYYWKNGNKVSLSPSPGSTFFIAGNGNDIYLGCDGISTANGLEFGFWYNGVFQAFPDRALNINQIFGVYLQAP